MASDRVLLPLIVVHGVSIFVKTILEGPDHSDSREFSYRSVKPKHLPIHPTQ